MIEKKDRSNPDFSGDQNNSSSYSSLKKTLLRLYLSGIGLAMVVALIILVVWYDSSLIQSNYAKAINISGRQRMLSQNLTKHYLLIRYQSPNEDILHSIDSISNLLNDSNAYLKEQVGLLNASAEEVELHELFDQIQLPLSVLTNLTYAAVNENKFDLERFRLNESTFLLAMDHATYLWQKLEEGQYEKVRNEVGILILILIIIFFGIALATWKLSDKVVYSYSNDLERLNRSLADSLDEKISNLRKLEFFKDSINAGLYQKGIVDKTEYWSEELYRMLGYEPGEFNGTMQALIDRIYPSDLDKVQNKWRKARESGKMQVIELRLRVRKGGYRWFELSGGVQENEQGTELISIAVIDINQRKELELSILEERKLLQNVIDSVPVNIYVKDRLSRKTLVNSEEMKLMGFRDKSEVIGKNDFELFPANSAIESIKEDEQIMTSGTPIVSKETSIDFENGRIEWFLTSKIPHRNVKDQIDGLIGVSVNITERKKLEQKLKNYAVLEAKAEEMEQLTYIASHDLKEPLLTVEAYLKELFADYGGQFDEEALYFQKTIVAGVKRMQNMVDGLLDYSRASAMEHLEVVDLSIIMQEVLGDLKDQIQRSNAEIITDGLPVIQCYPNKMRGLFQNLISNGIKYQANSSPIVRILTEEYKDYAQFCFEDNGIGIDSEYFDQIFSMFQRLHSKQEYEGTGIGLAQCQKIVEFHNGRIWVESVKGSGSKFYFTISKDL